MDPNSDSQQEANKNQTEESSSDDEATEIPEQFVLPPLAESIDTNNGKEAQSEQDLVSPRTKVIAEVRARRKTYRGYSPQGND